MNVNIVRNKKMWVLEILKDNNLIDKFTISNLSQLNTSNKLNSLSCVKSTLYLDSSCFIIFKKKYPTCKKKYVLTDALSCIQRLYNNNYLLFDKYYIKQGKQMYFVGLLVNSELFKFVKNSFKKSDIRSLFKMYYSGICKKYSNCLLIDNNQICLFLDKVIVYFDEYKKNDIKSLSKNISCALYDLLFSKELFVLYKVMDNVLEHFLKDLKERLEKQVRVIEQKIM